VRRRAALSCAAKLSFVGLWCGQVSRRKDGQRFKLLIEPDFTEDTPKPRLPLYGVYSSPICVLSKRKVCPACVLAAAARLVLRAAFARVPHCCYRDAARQLPA
jgi:hypothetical protein